MFMAAKQHTPGSTNTGKVVYQTDVNEADLRSESYSYACIDFWSNMLFYDCFLSLLFTETSQLLLIVSDGRGLFLEGKERVAAAVQAARSANIFVIFVVLDNPNSRVRNPFQKPKFSWSVKKKKKNWIFPFWKMNEEIRKNEKHYRVLYYLFIFIFFKNT